MPSLFIGKGTGTELSNRRQCKGPTHYFLEHTMSDKVNPSGNVPSGGEAGQSRPTPTKTPVPDTTPGQQASRPSASEPKPDIKNK